jgi:RNA polymerase sigma-70 factor (ECF subfamily)
MHLHTNIQVSKPLQPYRRFCIIHSMTAEEEKHLLLKIKSNPSCFGVVFDNYYKPIFNYIFKRVADYDISRDIAAETFLKAYLNIQSFSWKNISISSWLYRIATNEVNYYFRKHKYTMSRLHELSNYIQLFNNDEYLTEKQLFEKELELHNEFLKVQQALQKLDIKYQEVLSLRYFEKKSINEIADILNKKEGTVKSLLSRGTEKLRNLLII